MRYRRMPIEVESPEAVGYDRIRHNLAESSVSDVRLRGLSVVLDDLVLQYGDHLGHAGLRALIAADGPGLRADDVLLTPGAAGVLFIVATCLLSVGDHLVVTRPNYATNLETPRTGMGTAWGSVRRRRRGSCPGPRVARSARDPASPRRTQSQPRRRGRSAGHIAELLPHSGSGHRCRTRAPV